jgi:CheY-like chemotaxis protein
LVVEDDPDMRSIYAEALQFAGYEAFQAADGAEAVALVRVKPLSAVVMDLDMPAMTGLEALRLLKSDERTQEVPIVVVTGSANKAELLAARRAGCAALLAKPCPAHVLILAIEHVLRGEPVPLRFSTIGG